MKDFKNIQNRISTSISIILEKYGLDARTFLYKQNTNNRNANSEILNILAGYIDSESDKTKIAIENGNVLYSKISEEDGTVQYDHEFYIAKLLKTYLIDFYGNFFTIQNNEVSPTNIENFTLPSIEDKPDFRKNADYINRKLTHLPKDSNPNELELILLYDGTSYFAPNGHDNLAFWLNLNNIDLTSAIRFESSKSIYDFNFGSLYNAKFAETEEDKEIIQISHPQAEVLGTLYGSLSKAWHFMRPLDSQLKLSQGLGIGKNERFKEEDISGQNLRRLNLYMSDYFDIGEYVRELRLSNSCHNPLN